MRKPAVGLVLGFVLVSVVVGPARSGAVQRRAFVTSVTGTGDLSSWPGASGSGPLQRADSICRARAAAAGLANAATFRAWLSTDATDAYCHVQGLTGARWNDCGATGPATGGPWYNTNATNGRPFLPGLEALSGQMEAPYGPAQFDEFGDAVPYVEANDRIWTGTLGDGGVWGFRHCVNWSSAAASDEARSGRSHGSTWYWTSHSDDACDNLGRLLCLEPGPSDPVSLPWFPGALVFLTSATGSGDLSSWPEAGGASGLSAGDAICRQLATAAHLPAPASFVAWLSTGSVDAIDRITIDGPFRRVDRLQVSATRSGLADGVLSNTIHVYEDGTRAGSPQWAWTGTNPDGTAAGAAEDCLGWSSDAGVDSGAHGLAVNSSPSWTDDGGDPRNYCSAPWHRLYCFSNVLTIFWDGFDLTEDASRWSAVVP